MIYVVQDESKIPKDWLEKVVRLRATLVDLGDSDERKAFIDKYSRVWGEIKDQLLAMSHGKCWYSEAPDSVSDWHVDHFRPKGQARDEDGTAHEGYQWLAFDWKNYRIAGSYPNSPHKDEEGRTRGKWDYFPLLPGCKRASWEHQDCSEEVCLILDPASPSDPKLMTFDEEGKPIPSDDKNPVVQERVRATSLFLYLDSPRLVRSRKKKWRDTLDWISEYRTACPDEYAKCTREDAERVGRTVNKLIELASPSSEYAATTRACLRANQMDWVLG
jgi:uncharacterized protein (TIGR02646 family)